MLHSTDLSGDNLRSLPKAEYTTVEPPWTPNSVSETRVEEMLAHFKLRHADLQTWGSSQRASGSSEPVSRWHPIRDLHIYWFHQKDDEHYKKLMPWHTGPACRKKTVWLHLGKVKLTHCHLFGYDKQRMGKFLRRATPVTRSCLAACIQSLQQASRNMPRCQDLRLLLTAFIIYL